MSEKRKVLIIDDDPGLRKTLADILRVKGFEPLAAGDGSEGLALLRQHTVSLVLIDLGLPDLPGLEVLERVKADHPRTEAIILTGDASFDSAIEATNRGAFSYLVKPYEIDQLMLQIRRAIEKQQAETALRDSEARFRGLLESAADGIIIVNTEQQIIMVNEQIEKMFGYDRAELLGRPVEILIPARFAGHREQGRAYLRHPERRPMDQMQDIRALCKDGSELPVEISLSPLETPEGLIVSAVVRDITERKRFQQQLDHQANHDGLTDLPNRNLLTDRLDQALLGAPRHRREVAVLFVDLDHFKVINDSLGHDLGDRLLKIVAERLTGCVRLNDTVARQGGDDFVIVLSDLEKAEDTTMVARKIQETVALPLNIDEHALEMTCSIGISVYPKDGEDARTLLKNAEAAMYRAKERGRGSFQFFTAELNERAVARMTMATHLRRALERDELLLHYQPQVSLASGRITGMEALLRWQSRELGPVPPDQFIPLAEETGLIVPIGEWALRTTCAQNRAWQAAGLSPLPMAANLSARQFQDRELPGMVARILRETGLDPHFLELEITESMVMQDVESTATLLGELKGLGVQLSMDDFGTGYSSLSCLKRFPFDTLKIDISFVREITSDPESAAIARTIIAMAHNLKLRVIAEGVETEGQLRYLRAHGCDAMQGFFFSRPVPADEFAGLLRESRRLLLPDGADVAPEKTLLIVDDEPQVLALLARLLRKEGYLVLSAGGAEEGFELLALNRVGVVVCDQRMPGMDGIEFLRRVRDLYPGTVRIAISGYADLETVTEAVNRGAIFKFFTKPWEDEFVRESLREAFRLYARAREESPLSARSLSLAGSLTTTR
jgi:diguanylate cyclase (GGDEF)-like protein/PAS domain S-box-containing protein